MRRPGATVDPRQPVIVGVAQLVQKPAEVTGSREALDLMVDVAVAAAGDASAKLPGWLQLVVVIDGIWKYTDPGRLVADRIGASGARTALAKGGGHTPQRAVDLVAERIAAGELDSALLVGAEEVWSRRQLRQLGREREHVTIQANGVPDEVFGSGIVLSNEMEEKHGLRYPVHMYPLFETALRHHRAEGVDDHRARMAGLWSAISREAVRNPYSWNRRAFTADEIAVPGPGNRMVNFPYTKRCNSNIFVDQAAALLVCSAEAAAAAGVPADRWVFLHSAAEADDTKYVSNRDELFRSPPLELAGTAALNLAGCGVGDLGYVDLYSCFPSAVQIAAASLGLDESRKLTVTGGMPFAGGPANNYVTHSIATMTGLLRASPGAVGLVTANAGYLSKHAVAIYGSAPPERPFRVARCDMAIPSRECTGDYAGDVTIEAYTIMFSHSGPEHALFALRLPDGRRTWGSSADGPTMSEVMAVDAVGRRASRSATGAVTVDEDRHPG